MTAFLLVDFYTILFPDSFRRSFRMVWEILPTRGLQDWYAGIFGSIHPSYHLMSNLYNCNEEWLLCLEVFYRRNVILQRRGVAWPREVSDKQMDHVDRNLPIGSFRFLLGKPPCGFLFKKSGGCGILCGLAQRRFTPGQLGKLGSDLVQFRSFNQQVDKLDLSSWQGLGCWPG